MYGAGVMVRPWLLPATVVNAVALEALGHLIFCQPLLWPSRPFRSVDRACCCTRLYDYTLPLAYMPPAGVRCRRWP